MSQLRNAAVIVEVYYIMGSPYTGTRIRSYRNSGASASLSVSVYAVPAVRLRMACSPSKGFSPGRMSAPARH